VATRRDSCGSRGDLKDIYDIGENVIIPGGKEFTINEVIKLTVDKTSLEMILK